MMPHEVIAQIRREEYLLDVDASKEVLLGVKNLQRSLERALRLLSEDLYSKKTHFVLELIQNADDNQYKNGVKPKLRIQLSPSRLIVSNNETGFTEENVRVLCRVGQSSKLKKDGYIGEKGIGFKSVFTVSDAPEIHSNGFHFRFDHINKERLLGYVIPNWYPATEPIDDSVTTIILPAKLGESFAAQTLVDLDPRLLLFLRKIRQFELQMPGSNSTFVRSSKGFDVQLTTALHPDEGDVQRNSFRYVRFASQISMSDIRDEKREGIEATELVVAFPIDDAGKAAPEPSCPTFAFLPIRSFGFKFCIQGDFLLSSSREDILTGRPWNLRLRDRIATTIIGAIENFKKSPALAFTYFKFLPDEQDITDAFFHPVVGQVIDLLSQTPCIPSTGGEWLKPGEILSASSSFRNLFSANDVQELFGLDYPDARLEADAAMLARLGCKVITFTDVVDIFKHHGEWLTQRNQEWLAQLYAYLADLNQALLLKSGLLKVPCIPISDGTFVIPSSANVFYPLSYKRKYGFEKELVIINQELLEQASKQSDNVRSLFEKLGVKKDSPYELVSSYVLPRHAGDAWKKSENKALIGHLRYIKDKWPLYLAGASERGITEAQAFHTLDEAQDFSDEYWFSIEELLRSPEDGFLYLFIDQNQALYKRHANLPVKDDPYYLISNCRNTAPIHQVAYAFYDGEPVDCPELLGPAVEKRVVAGDGAQAEVVARRVRQLIVDEAIAAEDIVVLVAKRPKTRVYELLQGQSLTAGVKWVFEVHGQRRAVLVDTVARFKGLEAQAVVLWIGDEVVDEKGYEILYVGTTRAKSLLCLVGSERAMSLFGNK